MKDTLLDRDARRPQAAPVPELVSFNTPSSVEADQYRMLRHAIERLHQDEGCRVFGITSGGAGDGKTVTTLNLAGSLAQSTGTRVLVLCADLHRETATEYLGLPRDGSPGLAELVANPHLQLADVVSHLDTFNVSVLLAGRAQTRPYELLAAPRMAALLRDAREAYDYVLVDTPPVAPLADCRLLGRWVDGFIVVVAANKTPRKLLGEALSLLAPARIFGVVFNGDDQPLSPYYGYYAHHAAPKPAGPSAWWRRD